MDTEIQAEIRKVQKLSRYLRACCSFLIVVFAVIAVTAVIVTIARLVGNSTLALGSFKIPAGQQTLAMQIYAFLGLGFGFAVTFNGLIHLRALFVNLNAGEIYTSTNVLHLRRLGRLALLVVVVQLILPGIEVILLTTGMFDKTMLVPGSAASKLAEGQFGIAGVVDTLPPFIMAGLVILASWIMEMGRRTAEDAERMRRDAELVV